MTTFCRCGCGVEIVQAPTGRPRKWATENCRKRSWDEANGRPCPGCGERWLTAARLRQNPDTQCRSCFEAQERRAAESRLLDFVEMYNAGWLLRDIAAEFGWGESSHVGWLMVQARKRGLIGYRHGGYGEAA